MLKLRSIVYRFLKWVVAIFTCIVLLFSLAWASLQFDYFQTRAVNLVTNILSSSLKSKVTIGSISIGFFNKLILNDVTVNSLRNEKIASVKTLSLALRDLSYKHKKATFNRIYLEDAIFQIRQYKDGKTNIDDWLKLKSSDTTSNIWQFSVYSLKLKNAQFSYHYEGTISDPSVFDYKNTEVKNISGIIDNIKLKENIIACEMQDLSFKERCGFTVESLSSQFFVSNKSINFYDFALKTNKSDVYARFGHFGYTNWMSFKHFLTKVTMNCRIEKSHVSLSDISCFTSELKGLNQVIDAKGFFKGTVSDFVVTDASLRLLDSTTFHGSVEISGLPNIKSTYFFINVQDLKTSMNDIASIPLYPFTTGNRIAIDPMLKKFGKIHYKGNFTGFIYDVVAFGKISTSLGNISSDLLIKQLKKEKELQLSGNFSTEHFNLGALLGPSSKIGNTNMSVKISSTFDSLGYKISNMTGNVSSIEFNNYSYRNITFDGIITPKAFNGKASIKDQNLDMDFAGKCDLSKKLPVFDFDSHIGHLNFHRLNFFKGDSIADISFNIHTKLIGNKIDNMNGSIAVDSVLFENRKGQSYLNKALLEITNTKQKSDFNLESDIVDAHLYGDFNLSNLLKTFPKSISVYLPSLFEKSTEKPTFTDDRLKCSLTIKDLSELSNTLIPQIKLKKPVTFTGEFSSKQNLISINSEIPSVEFGSTSISNGYFNLHSFNSKLIYKANFDIPVFNVAFKNVTASGEIKNDSISFSGYWLKKDSVLYRGFIKTLGVITRNETTKKPKAIFTILPSEIIIADSIWNLSKSLITIDKTISINNFNFTNNQQRLSIEGLISESPNDSIYLGLSGFELKYFNKFIKDKNLGMEGKVTGYLSLFEIPNDFHFRSRIRASDFHIAGTDYGALYALSEWEENSKSIKINIFTQKGSVRPIDLKGYYFPDDNIMDLTLDIDNANLSIISVFVKDFFSDLKGYLVGQVRIQGKLNNPELHGYIDLKKASLFIDYLNTRYSLSGRCNVLDTKLIFDNIQIFDNEGNPATVNGDLSFPHFSKLLYNIVVDAKNFIGLDTKLSNNPYFYGKAYATGIAKIYGDLNHTQIDVSAKSNPNTIINIPVNNETTIENNNFLTFKTKKEKPKKKIVATTSNVITLNFDLDITTDADVQIILDEKVGDIIKSKGTGTILMNIDTKGKFNMYGTYEIFSGDYLFTMRNLINKKFIIEPGSKLTWNGNAFEANAEITARYKVKTALYELMCDIDTSEIYKRRIPIDCKITLTDKILSPNIAFSVDMKDADEKAKEVFNNLSEDEKNKHFMSLLILNYFMPKSLNSGQVTSVGSTGTEMVFSQLSNLASNINKNVNVGINYRTPSQTTKQTGQFELAMSTELLNNRVIVSVNGYSVGKSTASANTTENNAFGGDVIVEVKLNKKGTLRAKGFTRSNLDNIVKKGDTQGFGLSYSRSFNTFKDLFTINNKKRNLTEAAKQ